MSEPALKCENNAIFSKTIVKNCSFLLKHPKVIPHKMPKPFQVVNFALIGSHLTRLIDFLSILGHLKQENFYLPNRRKIVQSKTFKKS